MSHFIISMCISASRYECLRNLREHMHQLYNNSSLLCYVVKCSLLYDMYFLWFKFSFNSEFTFWFS